jgi:hypothetical protein
MLTIEMLPARNGDCLWITYGSGPHRHHVLIDGGYEASSELVRQRFAADAKVRLDLMILTHIDEDHILGGIQLLARDELTADRVDDVWFNGWKQLVDVPVEDDELGAKQGEYFSALLDKKGLAWNRAFAGGPICVPSNGAPPTATLKGGLKLTILSPDTSKLRTLHAKWKAELKGTKIKPGDFDAAFKLLRDDSKYDTDELGPLNIAKLAEAAFKEDNTAPNGSSIAVLAEYEGKRLLLTGDAHPSVMAATLERLGYTRETPLAVDVLKLSHHGSQAQHEPRAARVPHVSPRARVDQRRAVQPSASPVDRARGGGPRGCRPALQLHEQVQRVMARSCEPEEVEVHRRPWRRWRIHARRRQVAGQHAAGSE